MFARIPNTKMVKNQPLCSCSSFHTISRTVTHSLFNVLTKLADGGSRSVCRHEPKPPNMMESFLFWTTYPFRAVYEMLTQLASTLEIDKRARAQLRRGGDVENNRPSVEEDGKDLSFYLSPKIEAVETIRSDSKRLGISFTAILVSRIGQAVQKSLHELAMALGSMSVGFMLPSPKHAEGLTNDFRTTVLHVPMSTNSDIEFHDGTHDLERQLRAVKKSTAPTTAVLIWRLFGAMPTTWTWKYNLFKLGIQHDIFLSVFPGPKEQFSVFGREVTEMSFVVHPGRLPFPLAMSLLTYNGKIQFWLTAPTSIMSAESVGELGKCIEHELMSLNHTDTSATSIHKPDLIKI